MQDLPGHEQNLVTIGKASKLFGVSIDTIRRWDKAGKIQVTRTPGGTRLIPTSEIERIKKNIPIQPTQIVQPVDQPAVPPKPIQIVAPTAPPTTQPQKVDISNYKLHQKVIHHIKNTRPEWYRRYHERDWTNTLHTVIMVLFAIAVGSLFFYSEIIRPNLEQTQKELSEELGNVLAAAEPPRILSFQGRLTDDNNVPVSGPTSITFRIWNQESGGDEGTCTGQVGEECLWKSQDPRSVDPDQNGIFSVILGSGSDPAIPASLFSDNAALYLGVKVSGDNEMTPRQRIAAVSYALNSDSLDGVDSLSFLRSDTSDTFSGGTLTLTFAGTQNLATTSDLAGSVNVISLIGTPSSTSGTAQAIFVQQADSANTNGLDAAVVINNADTNLAITDAILITNSGGGAYGDYIDAPNFDVSNAGAVTAVGVNAGAGLLQGSLGLTITGAAVSLNASSNYDTNINTGTSTGTIAIGNSSSTNIKLGKFTTDNGVLYISETDGTISETAASTAAQCLQTAGAGTAPIWGACGGTFSGEVDDTTNDALTFTSDDASPPAGTVSSIFRDNSGDLNINTVTGKTINLQINGSDEYNFSSTGLEFNSNNITGVGNITVGEDNWIGIGAAAERIAFDGDGDDIELMGANVGIGTADPGEKLTVLSDGNDPDINIVGFYAQNTTQGIGFGYNTIRSIGTNENVSITLLSKGTGSVVLRPGADSAYGIAFQNSASGNLVLIDTSTSLATFASTIRAQGAVSEAAQSVDRIDIGVQSGTPRMVFEDNTYTIWQVDNYQGTFRWFTPGVEELKLDSTTLEIVSNTLAVNGDSITSDGNLVINANGSVDVQDSLNADSITSDAGISIAASNSYTGSGAVTLSSATDTDLTIDAQGTGNIILPGFGAACTALETNVSNQLVCGTDDGGALTPWISDIDADNFSLLDFGPNLTSRAATTIGSANNGAGASGLVTLNTGTGTTATGGITLVTGNASAGTAGNVSIDVGTSTASNGSILIGTAARAQTITIGNETNASSLELDSGTGAISIGNAIAKTINIGNATGATLVNIDSGTGGVTIDSTGAGDILINSTDTLLLDSVGVLELNSSGGIISIGNDAIAQDINVGTGAAARTITIGNTTTTTSLTLTKGASGNITFTDFASCTALETNGSGQLVCGADDQGGSGFPDTATFTDSTVSNPVSFTTGGTEIFNDTAPNIVADSTSSTVLVSVTINGTGDDNTDAHGVFEVRRIVNGNPACTDTQVGADFSGSYHTTSGSEWLATAVFLDSPGAANTINYTVCTDASGLDDGNVSTITVVLVELGADLAENYYTRDESIVAGHIVSIDNSLPAGAKKSSKLYDSQMLGVVSTAPGWTLDDAIGLGFGRAVPVALVGRVPVKVNGEGGPIAVGDLITSSPTPGVGMKATRAGYVIGRALTAFNCPDSPTSEVAGTDSSDGGSSCQGAVLAFVNTHYANPVNLASDGDLYNELNESSIPLGVQPLISLDKKNNFVATISANAKFVWQNSVGDVVAWVSDTGEAVFEKVTALVGDFQKLVFGELAVKKDAQTAGEFTFDPDQTEVFIKSDKVTEGSLIYVTPTTKTDGLTLYIKEQKTAEGFTVALERSLGDLPNQATASAKQTIKFNWLIINQD